jgi:hypothetical protein
VSAHLHPAAVAANSQDPYEYARGNFPRTSLNGRLVAILRPSRLDRGLQLIPEKSRCIRAGEVHELILTDELTAVPGSRVDRVAYLAFAEFATGGLIVQGDLLTVDGQTLGTLIGYDETHMPNHLNIVIGGEAFASGYDRGLRLEARFSFASRFTDYRNL